MGKPRRSRIGLVGWLGRGLQRAGKRLVRRPQLLLLIGVMLGASWAIQNGARQAEVFRIAHVRLSDGLPTTLREELIGSNLWTLDIRALAEDIERASPWLKEVRVIRQLPNGLSVEAEVRTPVAQVRISDWHPVDREGFILPRAMRQSAPELVRLIGLAQSREPLTVGTVNSSARLGLALDVLGRLRRAPALATHRLSEVNVEDPRQIRFVIDGATEVRCGAAEELDASLDRLQAALRAIARQQLAVRYIDVRFQEPVVEPRT